MLADGAALRLVAVGAVVLVGVGACIAWLPAWRQDPTGLASRVFVTAGAVGVVGDLGGVGSVLGLALAGMGVAVWWESKPPPEIPRPHLLGLLVAVTATALAALAVLVGLGPFDRLPDSMRTIAGLAVGGAGLLGCLAVADRARVRLREALQHRFDEPDDALLI